MGRKTKTIAKQANHEKSMSTSQQHIEPQALAIVPGIFSTSLKQKIDQFYIISKQLQTMKVEAQHKEENDILKEKRDQTSLKIEEAASNILNEQLKSLEGWIVQQQKKLVQEIDKINKVHEQAKSNLVAINVFSEVEIEQQLIGIKKKAEEKKQIHDEYGELLAKSKVIQEIK